MVMAGFVSGTIMSGKTGGGSSRVARQSQTRLSRRELLFSVASAVSFAALPRDPALAAVTDYGATSAAYKVSPNRSSVEDFLPQIRDGYNALVNLESNWDESTKDFDGDVVRRVLGTVGVKSPLFNIKKAFDGAWKALQKADVDIDVLEQVQDDYQAVLVQLSQVDFQLYSVNFTELRPTKQQLCDDGKRTLESVILRYRSLLTVLQDYEKNRT